MLLREGLYNTCCLTQIHQLRGHAEKSQNEIFVTGATDGVLAIWKPTTHKSRLTPALHAKVHQNAIKSLQVVSLVRASDCPRTYIIVTGGDDNAVAITRLDIVDDQGMNEEQDEADRASCDTQTSIQTATLLIPRAHAAAVTAVAVIPMRAPPPHLSSNHNSRESGSPRMHAKIISASNDQRLKCWELCIDLQQPEVQGFHVKKIQNQYSSIADAAALDVLMAESDHMGDVAVADQAVQRSVVVCGVGMQIWKVSI